MGMMINRRRVYGGKSLPYDSEVEYLESSNTQMIDTGISGGSNVEYEIDFQHLSDDAVNYAHLWGSSRPPLAPKLYKYDSTDYLIIECGDNQAIHLDNTTTRHTISYKNGIIYMDEVVLQTVGNYGFGATNFCLFGYYEEPGLKSKMRLYKCKIWKDGTFVRDYIPVRVSQVGYLYDKVSNQLFGNNAGTGAFILGQDLN